MKIAVLGTRGIPNYYGGFEQFAEYLSLYLVKEGHEVIVYNSHTHPYQEASWQGVTIVHRHDPEKAMGTAGQFIYDLNCILDLRKRKTDVVLQLGYTSSSVWGALLPSSSVIVTNMDGLEWKRTKYKPAVQRFLKFAERLGIKYSDYLVSDSIGIQQYLKESYGVTSEFIPYGATLFKSPSLDAIAAYGVKPYQYNMLIARLEPENSIEIILDGVVRAGMPHDFLIIGGHQQKFGEYLKNKYSTYPKIRFLGGLYDLSLLNNLRHYSNLYFHGHTVGGTNPSLLEAMASGALICAHKNLFNQFILEEEAFYFTTAEEVAVHLMKIKKEEEISKVSTNYSKIEQIYSWEIINKQYKAFFEKAYEEGRRR